MADLRVNIGSLQLKNPVTTASGTFGYGIEYADLFDISRLGGIFVKGTTIQPREGNPYPRMAETPSGMLNAVGLQNKGAQYFADHIYPQIKDIDTNMIVNVSGSSVETYVECAEKIAELERIISENDSFLVRKSAALIMELLAYSAGTSCSSRGEKIAKQALELITIQLYDPFFNVDSLSESLHISKNHLHNGPEPSVNQGSPVKLSVWRENRQKKTQR